MIIAILAFSTICNLLEVDSFNNHNVEIAKRDPPAAFKSCFEDLGCLETTSEWFHNNYRPRNLEPLDRHTIKTEFIFITKGFDEKKPLLYETIVLRRDFDTITNFKKDKQIILLIHDFTSNGRTGWIKHTAAILLNKKEANVISVDWEAGAEPPFEQAIANARVVALEIRTFLRKIKTSKTQNGDSIHLIGHGVGAHIAGYVGTYLNVGRITGLDPTGPFFEEMPPIVRLDPSDANYVEVLHTDAFNSKSQGALTPMGHADFYINGAKKQPECNQSAEFPAFTKIDRNMLKEGVILPACSHKRSFKYYAEALDSAQCEFTGVGCRNYQQFVEGNCTSCTDSGNNSNCVTFGLTDPPKFLKNRNFYINTRGEPPFCLNTYRIAIHFEKNDKVPTYQEGTFDIIMLDDKGVIVNASSNFMSIEARYHKFNVGQVHKLIYYASPPRLCKIVEVRIKWIRNPNELCLFFCHKEVYVSKISIQLLSSKNSYPENTLYPKLKKTKIENGSYVVFTACSNIADNATNSKSAEH